MREYNLFIIKDEYKKTYSKEQNLLYTHLKDLYSLNSCYNYGKTLFEQLCQYIHVNLLTDYFKNKYDVINNSFMFNNGQVFIKRSRIVIKSYSNLPNVLRVFNVYNKNIFVCDFKNEDYFFLNDLKNVFLQTV